MLHRVLTLTLASSLVVACQSGGDGALVQDSAVVDTEARAELMDAVKALEGRWRGESGESLIEVTSAGSVVRETMFPGEPHEMTNMFSSDGSSLVMTHYCAGGNQPRMRATTLDGGRLVFEADSVSDLNATDEAYMGAMTLVIQDADHFEQHWSSMTPGGALAEGPAMVMAFERVR